MVFAGVSPETVGSSYPSRPASKGAASVGTSRCSSSCGGRRSARSATPRSVGGKPARSFPLELKPPSHSTTLRGSLGLPSCPGAAGSTQDGTITPRFSVRGSVSEDFQQFDVSVIDAAVAAANDAPLAQSGTISGLAQHSAALTTAEVAHKDIADLFTWMQPRKHHSGWLSNMSRLAVDIDRAAQEWSAYLGGRCSRQQSLAAVQGGEIPPKDMAHTAEAASLLLRVVRGLPEGFILRAMLEPLTQELLEAVYRDWPPLLDSLHCLHESEISAERLRSELTPYFTIIRGYQGRADQKAEEAKEAKAETESMQLLWMPTKNENKELKAAAESLRAELEEMTRRCEAAERQRDDAHETYSRFLEQTRLALSDYSDMQYREQSIKADLRGMIKDNREKDAVIRDFQQSSTILTNQNRDLEHQLAALQADLEEKEQSLRDFPKMAARLEVYENEEAVHGIAFAGRIAQEVFDTSIELFAMIPSTMRGSRGTSATGSAEERLQAKWILDSVVHKLKAVLQEVENCKAQVKRFQAELVDLRELVPVWNVDAMEDLADAYNPDAAVHKQVFSMKDARMFAGLGTELDIPPYLRAEGFVRHTYISKAELEDFMGGFLRHNSEGAAVDMHASLFDYMQRKISDPDILTEFAYAFVCGLEAYRDDPDFELFDLMLCGAVHMSITWDQEELLTELQDLINNCLGGSVGAAEKHGEKGSNKDYRGRIALHKTEVYQVTPAASKRLIRGVLKAAFPDKRIERHNTLAQALHLTFQILSDAGSSPSPDKAKVSDLFENTADGTQTPLIEEIRRQHMHEVVEYTAELTRVLKRHAQQDEGMIKPQGFKQCLRELDAHISESRISMMVESVWPQGEEDASDRFKPVDQVLHTLRTSILVRKERLWVRVTTKEVVANLMDVGYRNVGQPRDEPPPSTGEEPKANSKRRESRTGTRGSLASMANLGGRKSVTAGTQEAEIEEGDAVSKNRRNRTVKVIDNPVQKADIYNDPGSLDREIERSVAGRYPETGYNSDDEQQDEAKDLQEGQSH
eukprot:TRINITY_DN15435_c0_g1_i1.p1 TRINITY_DN15435_c0_g1~~TRINITY_DN15435_c0_g1_i1.p1  ORF type:complete len:1032 (+),score=217.04 TRINITY_DN15435_c0_g1_i1:72-3167(+)